MKIGIIGGGNMGAAIYSGIKKKYKVCVAEVDKKRAQSLKRKYKAVLKDIAPLVKQSDTVIVAVKPQGIDDVLEMIKENTVKSTLVISIAAGITISYLEKKLGKKARVIRTMPNLPAQIGEGITAIAKGRLARADDVKTADNIFSCVGETVVVKEDLIDAVTAVSGSGPAYVFHFVENLMKASQALGLNKELSVKLVTQTFLGSAHLLAQSKEDAGRLREKVTSKGGTTQAALNVLKKQKVDTAFKKALAAAKKRAKELSKK